MVRQPERIAALVAALRPALAREAGGCPRCPSDWEIRLVTDEGPAEVTVISCGGAQYLRREGPFGCHPLTDEESAAVDAAVD